MYSFLQLFIRKLLKILTPTMKAITTSFGNYTFFYFIGIYEKQLSSLQLLTISTPLQLSIVAIIY